MTITPPTLAYNIYSTLENLKLIRRALEDERDFQIYKDARNGLLHELSEALTENQSLTRNQIIRAIDPTRTKYRRSVILICHIYKHFIPPSYSRHVPGWWPSRQFFMAVDFYEYARTHMLGCLHYQAWSIYKSSLKLAVHLIRKNGYDYKEMIDRINSYNSNIPLSCMHKVEKYYERD